MLVSVASPAVQDFSTWAHKGHDYTKTVIKQKYVFLISLKNFLKIFSFWEEFADTLLEIFK